MSRRMKAMSGEVLFEHIPDELLVSIFRLLPPKVRLSVSLVSRRLRRVVKAQLGGWLTVTLGQETPINEEKKTAIKSWAASFAEVNIDLRLLQNLTDEQRTSLCSFLPDSTHLHTARFFAPGSVGGVDEESEFECTQFLRAFAPKLREIILERWFFLPQNRSKSRLLSFVGSCANLSTLSLAPTVQLLDVIDTNAVALLQNLAEIRVCGGHVAKSVLRHLPKLARVSLCMPLQTDLAIVENCSKLESLSVIHGAHIPLGWDDPITCLTTCANLTSAQFLLGIWDPLQILAGNGRGCIELQRMSMLLTALTSLQSVEFDINDRSGVPEMAIPSLAPISNLTHVAILNAPYTIPNLVFLSKCSKLRSISFGPRAGPPLSIQSMFGVEHLSELMRLDLKNCTVYSVRSLGECTNLRAISLCDVIMNAFPREASLLTVTELTVEGGSGGIRWARNLEALQHLHLVDLLPGNSSSLAPTHYSTRLVSLHLSLIGPGIDEDYNPRLQVPSYPYLTRITIDRLRKAKDLAWFGRYGSLRDLVVSDCPIKSLKGIEVCTDLRKLAIENCGKVRDVGLLSGLGSLREIVLRDLPECVLLTDLKPLKFLRYVEICKLPIRDTSAVDGLDENCVVKVVDCDLLDI